MKARERFLKELDSAELRRDKREAAVRLFRVADSSACRHRAIVAHFDEHIEPCASSCDVCTGVGVTDLVGESMPPAWSRARKRERRDPSNPVFQRLRTLRKRLADAQGVPAYIVFSDQVLWDMVELRPSTPAQLLAVSGVGPAKLERYGEDFLEALFEE